MIYFVTNDVGYVSDAVFSSLKCAADFVRVLFCYDCFADVSVFRIQCFNGSIISLAANVYTDGSCDVFKN